MLCSPPPATTLASSCAGSEGFCAPCCRRSSQRSRIHNRPKTGRTLLLHERLRKRWTVRRKAAVIEAVRRGRLSLDQVCRIYTLSLEEFLAWERDMDRYGVPGLRVTRYQIYRQTETRKAR